MTKERLIKQFIILFILHFCESGADITYDNETDYIPQDTSFGNCICKSSGNLRYAPIENLRSKRSYSPTSQPLHCPPCEKIHCFKQRKRRLRCKGGWTLGICGCCKVCAKLEGDQCGGQHDYLGKCDAGLQCEPQEPKLISVLRNGVEVVYKVETGICRKVSARVVVSNDTCKPKCDPVYCLKNPRGICSATGNVERFQACQGHCQHTSCRACKFVYLDNQCINCTKDDFKCIREFGRCIRKKSCQPKDYPCGNPVMNQRNEGIFQCQVPECPLSN